MPGDSVSLGFVSANSALTLEAPLPGGWQTCHACDATYRNRELSRGEKLYCSRCGALLAAPRIGSARQHALALGLTGLVCLILANIFPIMTFDVLGAKASNHLITGVLGLFAQDYSPLAALVFFSAILAPALYLLLGLYAVVRLDLLGTVTWHRGVVFVILLSVCCLLLEQIRESAGQESDARLRPRFDPRVKRQRAVALIVSGAILYPFANLLPVMTMTVPGDRAALTVWGGVLELFHVGLWPAAVVVFLASMCVPFLKIAALGWLLWMDGKPDFRLGRTKLFRVVETVGTWSMVDIFLLSVLVAVGQLGTLASVTAEPGALFFAAVLVCTIFAAANYNERMIWRQAKV